MNMQLAHAVLQKCIDAGVETFVLCAGARNAPLVKTLGLSSGIITHYFYDERAAAFFALGRAKRDRRPVAVVTTSGTAVAETYPAVIEAYYSGYPLVIISADRPPSFRGTAAPQAIEQVNIFAQYAGSTFDIEKMDDLPVKFQFKDRPQHINVAFSEPLLNGEVSPLWKSPSSLVQGDVEAPSTGGLALQKVLSQYSKPLFLLSTLDKDEAGFVADAISHNSGIVYVEGISGCATLINSDSLVQMTGAHELGQLQYGTDFDLVIRIGGVPTTRFWRDLEDRLARVPVVSFSRLVFSGLSRDHLGCHPLSWLKECAVFSTEPVAEQRKDNSEKLASLLAQHPDSEVALLYAFLQKVPENSDVFIGNSLPIREIDIILPLLKNNRLNIFANRGVNGIDGLISTALGLASPARNMFVVVGDLSTLYDFNALSQRGSAATSNLSVVILNNGGGKIFARMFNDEKFENRHSFEFKKWAEMFGFDYQRIQESTDLGLLSGGRTVSSRVIEIIPNETQSGQFWDAYGK